MTLDWVTHIGHRESLWLGWALKQGLKSQSSCIFYLKQYIKPVVILILI